MVLKRESYNRNSETNSSNLKFAGKLMLAALLLSSQLAIFAVPSASAASTIYVSTSGNDTTGTGAIGSPYATITKGVSTASSGDTVLVGPGTYHEMVNITTKVTLMSISGDPTSTTIDATGLSMGVFIRDAAAAGTIVIGFTVENANNHGIYAQDTSKVIIEHNIVTNNGLNPTSAFSGEDKAINLVGTSYSLIVDNQVVNNKYGGIAINDNGPVNPGFYSPGTLNAAVGNVISGNTVVGNHPHHCSIVVSSYNQGAGVINTVVSNNIVVDNSAGIVIAANTPNSQSINNSVLYNTILNNGEAGVVVHANAPGANNIGTLIMGNTISGNGLGFDVKSGSNVEIAKYTGVLIGGESSAVSPHDTWVVDNVFHNQFNGVFQVNGTETQAFSNTFDATVTHNINGTSATEGPMQSQIDSLAATVGSVQQSLTSLNQASAKASDLSSLASTVNALSGTVNQLSSTSAKQSDLNSLSNTVNSLQSSNDISTISYVAYGAIGLAIVAILVAVFMSRKGPSSKP